MSVAYLMEYLLFQFSGLLSSEKQPAEDPSTLLLDVKAFGPDDTPRTWVTNHGTVCQDYSGITLTTREGAVHHAKRDGGIDVELPVVERMEIADLTLVESHHVNRVHETTSHVIHFVGGGIFTCVYDARGTMIEISARHLRKSISPDGVITIFGTAYPKGS